VRRHAKLSVALAAILAALASSWPAAAWHRWPYAPGAWGGTSWGPGPLALHPVKLPYRSRFYYPPGVPLTYFDAGSGTTHCLSQPTGFYYICGYSRPAPEAIGPAYPMPPEAAPPVGEQGRPPASGVLLFRLPQDAEAAVNGVPVGLSGGLGIAAVPPGRHRVVVRASGAETEHAVTVSPHAILIVTPGAIVPTEH
jgi:hypothetical protein